MLNNVAFQLGNKLAKGGNRLAGIQQQLREQLLDSLRKRGKLQRLEAWLWRLCKHPDGAIALAAIKELLNRSIGKEDANINLNLARKEAMTIDDARELLIEAGVPESRWPPMVREAPPIKQIESTIIESDNSISVIADPPDSVPTERNQ